MLEKFDSLIGRLIQARQRGLLVNGQENEGIESLDTAYQIQEKVLEGLGSESIFWKVGSTSIEAQRKLGTDELRKVRSEKIQSRAEPELIARISARLRLAEAGRPAGPVRQRES